MGRAFLFSAHMADILDSLDDGAKLADIMRRFYPLIIESAFGDASLAGIPVAWDLDNPFVQGVLDRLAEDIADVAETTKDEIRALVGRQAAEGWSLDELADAIETLADVRSRTRAELISRTETASAYSQGSIAAFKASGVVSQIEWLTADGEVCPICEDLNGKRVDIDQSFAGGVAHPPAHPNCRCAILPVVE